MDHSAIGGVEVVDATMKQDGQVDFEPIPKSSGAGVAAVRRVVRAARGRRAMVSARPWEQGTEPAGKFSPTLEVE